MENASAAFLDAVRKSMPAIRTAVGATTVDPDRLTCAERLRYEGYLRRPATGEAILDLSRRGMPIRQIVRMTGHSRKLVRNLLRGLAGDVFRSRQSSLEAYRPQLDAEWTAGCRNGAELWRLLRASWFTGSLRVVGEWATRRRRSERTAEGAPVTVLSAHPRTDDDNRAGQSDRGRGRDGRDEGVDARRGPISAVSLPGDDPRAAVPRSRRLDRGRSPRLPVVLRQRSAEGQGGRRRGAGALCTISASHSAAGRPPASPAGAWCRSPVSSTTRPLTMRTTAAWRRPPQESTLSLVKDA